MIYKQSYQTREKRSKSLIGHIGWNKTHGMDGTPVYKSWISAKSRCKNENDKDYKNYGGRGIKVCKRWKNSFEKFYKDMGDKPSAEHSLDRINVNGNYEPSNCKWSTIIEQNNNRRTNLFLTLNGVTLTKRNWSRKLNIPESTLFNRLKRGWSVEKSLTHNTKYYEN